jgi:hypothetical protein
MFIINFSFFLILLKIFFLVILNLNNYITFKLKNYFIYYFIYDIIISILVLTINFIYAKNFILQKLLINLLVVALIFQSYVFLYIIYVITKKQNTIENRYKKLFYYYIFISIFKIILTVFYYYKSTFFNFDFIFILAKYKIFFFSNIICHFFFQYCINFKCFYDFYFYIKNYKINSKLKKSYNIFFYSFLIKNILYDFLIIFFDICLFFNINNYFYIIDTFNIYQILYIISSLSLINYFSIFFIIFVAKKEISTCFIFNNNLDDSIFFSTLDSFKIISHDVSFYYFLLSIIKKNMKKKLGITDQMNGIILYNNKDYSGLFDENNIIYKEIIKKKIISYDYYYNILNAYLFIKNNINSEVLEEKVIDIVFELEKYNIRLITPFYINNKLNGYLILFNSSFVIKKILTHSDVSILYNLSNYITFTHEKLTNNIFYTQLTYQKKISECNLIENNSKYSQMFKKINEKIKDIRQVFVYENKKKILKFFSNIEDSELINHISNIHENQQIVQPNKLNQRYIFININNVSYSILSSGKITLHKHYASFYTILPFIKKEFGLLYNLYYHDRIDTIFSYDDKFLNNDKIFFSSFDDSFNIKIIMIDLKSNSFLKMISYFSNCILFDSIYISFENINEYNYKKIFDYYNYLLYENKKKYIFFIDIEKESKIYQKYILDAYINYVLKTDNIAIKLFFMIFSENQFKNIHQELIQISSYISLKISNQKEINYNFLLIILNNYSNKILNKKFTLEHIDNFIKEYFNDKVNNIYDFIDLFEKNILVASCQNILIDESAYIKEAIKLKRESLKNIILMKELLKIYKNNYTKIASLIEVHKSTVSRYFKNINNQKN